LDSVDFSAEGRQFLNDLFRIDSTSTLTDSTDSKFLVEWIQAAMDYMAMLRSTQYEISNYSCENFAQSEITDARQAVTALYQISNVYYNFTGTTCTELLLMMCSEGPPNDFFENQCEAYNEFLDVNAIATEYGFDYSAASNIVFTVPRLTRQSSIALEQLKLCFYYHIGKNYTLYLSDSQVGSSRKADRVNIRRSVDFFSYLKQCCRNGNLDPWSSGGVYANTSGIQEITKNGIYTFLIDGSAHHLDLRQPNTCDPPSVKNARFQFCNPYFPGYLNSMITNIIDCWSCKSDLFGYPWGQIRGRAKQGFASSTCMYHEDIDAGNASLSMERVFLSHTLWYHRLYPKTKKIKYLYNNTYYKIGGPIFFYAGNEAAIEGFAENTGIMFDLAPHFDASIVFAEHRYYGESKPFGNLSYSNVKNLGFLTSTQAMGDFAKFLPYFKASVLNCSSDTPVIAFGGSYGGMLAVWFRIKYPHIVTGAWASSAPVLLFKGANVDPGAFDKVVTEDFIECGCNREAVYKAFNAIRNLANTTAGLTILNEMFVIEAKSNLTQASDADYLVYFIREAFEYLAMVNYPYPTSFLLPLPGWPVKEACQRAQAAFPQTPTTDRDLVNYLYIISNLYYNYTGTVATNCVKTSVCGDQATAESGDDAFGWPW
uniref:Uncharacterized protein n=1 Tax=Parascaris equorum TaxID=6256 RepID=A0A914RR23_PAREQ